MKAYEDWKYDSTIFYLQTKWRWGSASRLGLFTPSTHDIGVWESPITGLDHTE
jgi:hypothetical protein